MVKNSNNYFDEKLLVIFSKWEPFFSNTNTLENAQVLNLLQTKALHDLPLLLEFVGLDAPDEMAI